MRFSLVIILLLATCATGFSQSGFETLKNKFRGSENVFSFSTSGLFARTALWIGGERDYKDAIKEIVRVRFITIPKSAFAEKKVTVNGFKKVLEKSNYQELTTIKDHGDNITLYLEEGKKNKHNRYFLLIDQDSEVVGLEIKGYINEKELLKHANLSHNQY